ncbi:LpqB family beta-propeller domain-containing protein [Paramicrobacterium agarici]|uniref:Sporulation and spore germination protein n=1 Tax=Paramicrobacterium agarici TaxID=630514 RepID=A0A2A9DWV9_9MICO|nr:LpqB family beta-propeller domain-containing protein [Microbacterium agarici]PFG30856.1 sporulation and spore germination protein [Microbacterium agarici]
MRRVTTVVAIGAIMALLVGCAGIPRSGSVHEGNPVGEDENSADDVTLIADAPVPGASQEDLLKGFIAAASSPLNNYAVAREFLAPDFRLEWNPDASVTLDDPGGRQFDRVSDSAIDVAVSPTAVVDDSGVYSERAGAGTVEQSYSFAKVGDEWRITEAPNGILLEQSLFETVFDQHALRFFTPDWTSLVPDLRWFPSGSSSATRIVTELLAGPSEWLAQSVTTAFPDGTRLARSSVPVTDGEAQVDLSRDALTADDSARKRMKAQLVASLENVAGAGIVSILFDGQPTDIPSLTVREPRVDSRPLIMTEEGFGYAAGSGIEEIAGLSEPVESLDVTAAAINSENTQIAVLSDRGVYSISAGEDPVLVDGRSDLIAPTIDDAGFVWTVPAGQPGGVRVHDAEGTAFDLQPSWPEASTIVSLELSRDGTRIVALIDSGGTPQLLLAGVRRGADGAPTSLSDTVRFPVADGTPLSATWVDDKSVAVLTSESTNQVQLIELGGPSTSIGAAEEAEHLVGSNGAEELRALTSDGDLLSRRGSGWQTAREGVRFIATQIGSPSG